MTDIELTDDPAPDEDTAPESPKSDPVPVEDPASEVPSGIEATGD